ncbi:hypothetical protein [Fibrobacter sp. UWB12]|uniref:hypothetical protein n=1 Tax=Fibrobacter sp. UWB12 TaxID=1896203 RepID=UPI000912B0CA|nr:hypothetical protein [Fibrobacter sp. UWB12]SHK26880.1 hypothetical protein SAMN05720759_101432 [Fibrobacter sp. UWB12]
MGIFISLHASNKVDPAQWEKAYEETLVLVDAFNFIEVREFEKFDFKYFAAVKSEERKHHCGVGWLTEGDGNFMMTAEDFFLPRKISPPKEKDEYCDPLMYIYAQNGSINFENPYVRGLRSFWGGKTQGKPYHNALLAIGCLLDDRLNGEVLCSDDITYGQCKYAVDVANKILKKKIGMPLRCRIEDLYKRVRKLPIEKDQMLEAFAATYLGVKDEHYYKFVDEHFSDEEQHLFIKKRINNQLLGSYGFDDSIQEILSYNVPIASVCSAFLEMDSENKKLSNDKDPYKVFINHILDTDIYLPKKDLRNCLDVDENTAETMSVEKQFASFMFFSARDRRVARYIPLDKLKEQFIAAIGDRCDVGGIVDNYIAEKKEKLEKQELDSCAQLNDVHDELNKQIEESRKNYDISDIEHLIFYKKGNTIEPNLLDYLKKCVIFFKSLLEQPQFKEIPLWKYENKCRFLELQNKSLYLMNSVWLQIFENIRNNPDSFKRYYVMVRTEIHSDSIHSLIRAYVENDDFYEFCQTL